MSKRHADALMIDNGACNPSGIAHSIVEACAELMSEPSYTGTDMMRRDPAIRLMVNQLSYLMGNGEMDLWDSRDCRQKCHDIVDGIGAKPPSLRRRDAVRLYGGDELRHDMARWQRELKR